MDLSLLASLGKIAGLGGLAIGLVALLVRPIIDRVSSVPSPERAPMLRFVAMGAFGIGALGIVAWLVSGLSGGNVTAQGGGVAAGRDISGTTITTNAPRGAASPPVPPSRDHTVRFVALFLGFGLAVAHVCDAVAFNDVTARPVVSRPVVTLPRARRTSTVATPRTCRRSPACLPTAKPSLPPATTRNCAPKSWPARRKRPSNKC